ncbi:DUF982 domain-containing protein [Candidatus Phyllobacterium onerii]|uniref:DUF982 domain-containing protein n=1 Tax=Candidatus Phyllobacterium onerii TaxID=3020828 RepID=UPI00232B63E4|nr:DUF982 domain-containing protein [Phyllobacterium sp. IY22]
MNSYFDSPIFVTDGSRIVREIATLADAIEFLDSWPDAQRDIIYETAWRTCCEVFDGHKPLSVAHAAFDGFARKAKILEDSASVMPWIMNAKSGGGLMTA